MEDKIIVKDKKNDIMSFMTASIVHISFLTCLFSLLFINIPENNKEIFYTLLGVVTAGEGLVQNYYFSSSKDSRNKTETITEMNEQLTKIMYKKEKE